MVCQGPNKDYVPTRRVTNGLSNGQRAPHPVATATQGVTRLPSPVATGEGEGVGGFLYRGSGKSG